MNNIIRKFNQNRKVIFFDIFIIVSVIIAIQVVNSILKKQHEQENVIGTNETIQNTSSYNSRDTVLSDGKVNTKINEENTNVIDNFIKACNEGKTKEAYNLISEDCKNQMFPTEEDFINNYYSRFFDTKKEYNYQSWITKNNRYTYKIKLYEDMMLNGGQDTASIEEYYTIVKTSNNGNKLNINNFVSSVNFNREENNSDIKVKIKEKNTFMEYETYLIEITNNTQNDILMDSQESADTMYLIDKKENKYPSYSHELSYDKLWIRSKETRTIEIKFTKQYSSSVEVEKLEFSDIILNYNEYRQSQDKKQYKNRVNISIKL